MNAALMGSESKSNHRPHRVGGLSPRGMLVAMASVLVCSCAAIPVESPHVNIDRDGYVADDYGKAIDTRPPNSGETAEDRAVQELMAQISAQVAVDCARPGKKQTHLALYVHGGLTSTRAAMASAVELDASKVFDDREIRPIYINWNSSLNSAIADDILWIRGGQRLREGVVFAPIVAAWRLAVGVFNTLPNWYYQLIDETRFYQPWQGEKPTAAEIVGDGAIGLVHAPFSIVSTPLFTGFGRGAWEMMSRRIDMMFAVQKVPRRFGGKVFGRRMDVRPGVMRTFLDALDATRGQWERDCDSVTLDFLGHSMGTLVGTRILREYPSLEFDRVVFLAAASTVEDFVTTIPAYLARHPESAFYSLGLSIIDESNELTPLSFALPRGSLLVWVDNYFDPILSPEDYRFGDSFNETLFKAPFPPGDERCKRINIIKISGPRSERQGWPRKHGDFNDADYLGRLIDLTANRLAPDIQAACGDSCKVYDPCPVE